MAKPKKIKNIILKKAPALDYITLSRQKGLSWHRNGDDWMFSVQQEVLTYLQDGYTIADKNEDSHMITYLFVRKSK